MWHHLNLYVSVLEVNENQKEDIQRLIYESNRVISDMLFSKVQSIMNVSFNMPTFELYFKKKFTLPNSLINLFLSLSEQHFLRSIYSTYETDRDTC